MKKLILLAMAMLAINVTTASAFQLVPATEIERQYVEKFDLMTAKEAAWEKANNEATDLKGKVDEQINIRTAAQAEVDRINALPTKTPDDLIKLGAEGQKVTGANAVLAVLQPLYTAKKTEADTEKAARDTARRETKRLFQLLQVANGREAREGINRVEGKVDGVKAAVEAVKQEVDKHTGQLAKIEETQGNILARLTSLEDVQNTVVRRLTALENANETQRKALEAFLNAHDAQLKALYANHATKTEIQALQAKIDAMLCKFESKCGVAQQAVATNTVYVDRPVYVDRVVYRWAYSAYNGYYCSNY